MIPEEIWIEIYESEMPIAIDLKNNKAYIDCETTSSKLTSDMLYELHLIVILLNNNINVLRDLLKGDR